MTMQHSMLLLVIVISSAGCTGSRWARDHPVYAEKYPHHTGNLGRMAKQAVDARHVAGSSGTSLGISGRDAPFAGGVSLSRLTFPDTFDGTLELNTGLTGLVTEGDGAQTLGVNAGARVQTPTRLAPFAGIGGYLGLAPGKPDQDNHDSPFEEEDTLITQLLNGDARLAVGVYPEAGVHYWVTSHLRLTASAKYYVTTISDDSPFTLYGISLSWLDREFTPIVDSSEFDRRDPTPVLGDAEQEWPRQYQGHEEPNSSAGARIKQTNQAYQSLVLPEPAED